MKKPIEIKVGQVWRPKRGIDSAEIKAIRVVAGVKVVTVRKFNESSEKIATVKVATLRGDYVLDEKAGAA